MEVAPVPDLRWHGDHSAFLPHCTNSSASGALGHPGAPTMFRYSAPSSNAVLWPSMWRCPRAWCQAPPSCWSLGSNTTAFSLLASCAASTQAAANCSPPTAVGYSPAFSTFGCSPQCSPQHSEDYLVRRLLQESSILSRQSHPRLQQELKLEPPWPPRALEKRQCAHRPRRRIVHSTRTPPPLRRLRRRRSSLS